MQQEPSGPAADGQAVADQGWLRRNRGGIGLAVAVFLIHSFSPSVQIGDSRLSALTAWQFLTHFDLHLQDYPMVAQLGNSYDLVFAGGNTLPYFPWPTMLLAIPADILLLLTGRSAADLTLADPSQTFLVEIPTASLIVAITAWVLRSVLLSVPRMVIPPRVATFGGAVFAFGTSAWSLGSRALWQQTASMLFLSLALLCALRLGRSGRSWEWGLGACLALAAMARPTNAVIALLFVGWIVLSRRSATLRAAGAFLAVLAAFCWYSYSQYGSIIPPYYTPGRLQESPAIGVAESLGLNLISPSRGLIIFDPIVLLAVAGIVIRLRRHTFTGLDAVLSASVIGQWLVIAKFGSTGGTVFGPRLMLDIVPFLVVLAAPTFLVLFEPGHHGGRPWPRRLAIAGVVAVLIWGLFVNATGALLRDSRCWSVVPISVDAEPARIWDWSDPQFLRPYRDLVEGHSLGWVLSGSCTPEAGFDVG
jgi:hypothetical protein